MPGAKWLRCQAYHSFPFSSTVKNKPPPPAPVLLHDVHRGNSTFLLTMKHTAWDRQKRVGNLLRLGNEAAGPYALHCEPCDSSARTIRTLCMLRTSWTGVFVRNLRVRGNYEFTSRVTNMRLSVICTLSAIQLNSSNKHKRTNIIRSTENIIRSTEQQNVIRQIYWHRNVYFCNSPLLTHRTGTTLRAAPSSVRLQRCDSAYF